MKVLFLYFIIRRSIKMFGYLLQNFHGLPEGIPMTVTISNRARQSEQLYCIEEPLS